MMVRINLLPGKKGGAANAVLWRLVTVMVLLFVAELGFLYYLHDGKASEIKKRTGELTSAQQHVKQLESEVANLPNLEKQNQELEQRERALAELAAIRIGPQHLLDELQRILMRPTTKASIKQAKSAQWNVGWEAENVFLNKFYEESDGLVYIEGNARGLDDVAEFWLRLRSSKLFQEVRLANIVEEKSSRLDLNLLHFVFTVRANFYYQTQEGLALIDELESGQTEDSKAP